MHDNSQTGQDELFGFAVFGESYPDVLMFILPPGAFIALGFILAGVNLINRRLKARSDAAKLAMIRAEAVRVNATAVAVEGA